MLPRQKATKHATPDSWDLVPSRWDKMFSAKLFSEKFQKVPEHFRYPLKLFWAWSETFSVLWFLSAESINSGYGSFGTFPVFLSENSQKFPDQFWHPLIISMRCRNPFWPNNIFRNIFSVLPKLFRCSLSGTLPLSPKLFRWFSLRLPV